MTRGKKEKTNKTNKTNVVALQTKESQSPLNTIRTETVLSRLPVHNLNKKGTFEIKITKKKKDGEVDLSWEVSSNSEYGQPRQLAYKIDTIVINRLIDLNRHKLPKLLRLGNSRELCLELGLSPCGPNILNLQKAFRQNAGALIVAKVNYSDKDGLVRSLDTTFTRYSVNLRGEHLPDGTVADAIYINFSDEYFEVLKTAQIRPLDFDYLKELQPSAQRFYEIVSYKIFAALSNNKPTATLAYSEFCTFSAQTRYYDYEHFKKQMYKIHKPHMDSGYIAGVEYEKDKDEEGKIDWLMSYKVGAKARAEYEAFNNKKKYEEDAKILSLEAMAEQSHPRTFSKALLYETETLPSPTSTSKASPKASPKAKTNVSTRRNPAPSPKSNASANSSDVLMLVQRFHLLARGVEQYQPYLGSREESQAQTLLNNYGKEKAEAIVSFSVKEAKRTNFEMRTFGAIFQYVSDAIAAYDKTTLATKRKAEEEAAEKKAFDLKFASLVSSLTLKQQHDFYEQAKQQLLTDLPTVTAEDVENSLQPLLKSVMIDLIESAAIKNKK